MDGKTTDDEFESDDGEEVERSPPAKTTEEDAKNEGGTEAIEYGRYFAFGVIMASTMICIYIGCQRSLTLYYFEQHSAQLLYMNSTAAACVPLVFSVLIWVSYLSIKRTKTDVVSDADTGESSPNDRLMHSAPENAEKSCECIQAARQGSEIECKKAIDLEKGPAGRFLDFVLKLFAVHMPIWLSVYGTFITGREVIQLAQSSHVIPDDLDAQYVNCISIVLAVSVGIFHEMRPTWLTNNILALCGTYAVIAYVETVSYFAGFIFVIGMALFDLFWMFFIPLIVIVTAKPKAPIMLMIPSQLDCKRFQQLATLDIMVPGLFLNLIYKYSTTTYDSMLFTYCFAAVLLGLALTFAAVVVRKQTMPAMPLPTLLAIAASLLLTEQPNEVWQFAIRKS